MTSAVERGTVPRPRGPEGHAQVVGVHGAPGRTGWKGFYGRRQLRSATEAVEWATLPPGGVSGEHRHTRTEEIYVVLTGRGELVLDGVRHEVRPGTLALTPPGTVHGLKNAGGTTLDWWVVEAHSPRTTGVLAGRRPEEVPTVTARVFDLTETPTVDARAVFSGPITTVRREEAVAGGVLHLDARGREVAGFLQSGLAELLVGGDVLSLRAPVCFLVPEGSSARVEFARPSELYLVDLEVAAR